MGAPSDRGGRELQLRAEDSCPACWGFNPALQFGAVLIYFACLLFIYLPELILDRGGLWVKLVKFGRSVSCGQVNGSS